MVLSHKSPSECYRELYAVYELNTMRLPTLYKWHKRFRDGRTDVADDQRSGRPSVISNSSCALVNDLVAEDRRVGHREISERTGLSKGTVLTIMHEHLQLRKVVARWVPHSQTDDMRQRRVDGCRELLEQHRREGRRMIGRILTGDETWVHYFEPESKRESMQWIKKGEPNPTKYRTKRSLGKVLYMIFWDADGIVLMHQVPEGQRINAAYYCHFLRNILQPALKAKRPGIKLERFLFQHDNAPAHSAYATSNTLTELGFTPLHHPPYSPDLAPSDYHLFANLKAYVRGRHFTSRSALGSAVFQWSKTITVEWLAKGMMQLPRRWQQCIDAQGAYFEG